MMAYHLYKYCSMLHVCLRFNNVNRYATDYKKE